MKTRAEEPSDNLRDKTDKSLEDERLKTDEYLDQKTQTATDDAEVAIRENRMAADRKRERCRAEDDLDKTENRLTNTSAQSTKSDDKSLLHERKRSDEAQNVEREKEDRVRSKERFQKRLIAEALLESERKDTDTNLLDERVRLDLASTSTKSVGILWPIVSARIPRAGQKSDLSAHQASAVTSPWLPPG